jgi:hypothetical protein
MLEDLMTLFPFLERKKDEKPVTPLNEIEVDACRIDAQHIQLEYRSSFLSSVLQHANEWQRCLVESIGYSGCH